MNRNRVFLWVQAVLCIAVCALLAAGAISIFRDGMAVREAGDATTWIYTREKVAEQFWRISPLIFGALAVTAAGIVLGIKDEKADKPVKDIEITRDLLCSNVSIPSDGMINERRKQKNLQIAGIVIAALSAVPVLIYMLNGSHFETKDLEEMLSQTLLHVLPWIVIGIGGLVITDFLRLKSVRREADYAKEEIKAEAEIAGAKKDAAEITEESGRSRKTGVIRAIILAAAAVCIIHGVYNGSMRDVFVKATNICTECIGLG